MNSGPPHLRLGTHLAGLLTLALALGITAAPALAHPRTALLSVSHCSPKTAKAKVRVDATNQLKFTPASVCLKKGGTVTWHNTGDISHTTTDEQSLAATASDAQLPAGAKAWTHPLAAGKSWSLKFTVTGNYKYFCIPHEQLGMKGRIEVVK